LKRRASPLIAPVRSTAALGPAPQLFVTDHRQYWPQPLGDDGSLVNLANFVEHAVGELHPL
jgi:hypothetical protein